MTYTPFTSVGVELEERKFVCSGRDYQDDPEGRHVELDTVEVVPSWHDKGVDIMDCLDPDVLDDVHAEVFFAVTGEERRDGYFDARS